MVVPAGTQHQFVNTGPTPLVAFRFLTRHCSLYLKKAETDSINPRSSTQSILPPNTTPKPYIRQRKKATRKKRMEKTRRRTGVRIRRRRTKRTALSILVGNTDRGYINILHILKPFFTPQLHLFYICQMAIAPVSLSYAQTLSLLPTWHHGADSSFKVQSLSRSSMRAGRTLISFHTTSKAHI